MNTLGSAVVSFNSAFNAGGTVPVTVGTIATNNEILAYDGSFFRRYCLENNQIYFQNKYKI